MSAANADSFNNYNSYAASQLAYNAPSAAQETTYQALGSQDEVNKAFEQIQDQFVSAQQGLAGQAAAAKRAALEKKVAGQLFKHFFTVYEAGFELSRQWADMEANV